MTMDSTIIPTKYQADDETTEISSSNVISVKDGYVEGEVDDATVEQFAQSSIEIIELQASASITPIDNDSFISDTFSDSGGYKNTVDSATANFSTNKYIRALASETVTVISVDSGYSTSSLADTFKRGHVVLANSNCTLVTVTKTAALNADSCGIYNYTTGALITSVTFTGNVATFSTDNALSNGTKYIVAVFNSSGNWNQQYKNENNYPHVGALASVTNEKIDNGAGWEADGTTQVHGILSMGFEQDTTGIEANIICNLPAIEGTVTHTQLVINGPDRETGDNITYNLIDSDTTSDDDLEVNTKNALILCDGTKISEGQIQINLIGKETSPTPGVPSVKSYCLKIWKA